MKLKIKKHIEANIYILEVNNKIILVLKSSCFHVRSSHFQMFFKIGVVKNFTIFTGKHLSWNLFLIKLLA